MRQCRKPLSNLNSLEKTKPLSAFPALLIKHKAKQVSEFLQKTIKQDFRYCNFFIFFPQKSSLAVWVGCVPAASLQGVQTGQGVPGIQPL